MQLGEFIYEQPAVGDIEYIFKHALTTMSLYNSLLTERRKHCTNEPAGDRGRFTPRVSRIISPTGSSFQHERQHAQGARVPASRGRAGHPALKFFQGESLIAAALDLVMAMPESPERDARELQVRSALAETT